MWSQVPGLSTQQTGLTSSVMPIRPAWLRNTIQSVSRVSQMSPVKYLSW